jgi:hypothetical protein
MTTTKTRTMKRFRLCKRRFKACPCVKCAAQYAIIRNAKEAA